jgi:hypothetical protein
MNTASSASQSTLKSSVPLTYAHLIQISPSFASLAQRFVGLNAFVLAL